MLNEALARRKRLRQRIKNRLSSTLSSPGTQEATLTEGPAEVSAESGDLGAGTSATKESPFEERDIWTLEQSSVGATPVEVVIPALRRGHYKLTATRHIALRNALQILDVEWKTVPHISVVIRAEEHEVNSQEEEEEEGVGGDREKDTRSVLGEVVVSEDEEEEEEEEDLSMMILQQGKCHVGHEGGVVLKTVGTNQILEQDLYLNSADLVDLHLTFSRPRKLGNVQFSAKVSLVCPHRKLSTVLLSGGNHIRDVKFSLSKILMTGSIGRMYNVIITEPGKYRMSWKHENSTKLLGKHLISRSGVCVMKLYSSDGIGELQWERRSDQLPEDQVSRHEFELEPDAVPCNLDLHFKMQEHVGASKLSALVERMPSPYSLPEIHRRTVTRATLIISAIGALCFLCIFADLVTFLFAILILRIPLVGIPITVRTVVTLAVSVLAYVCQQEIMEFLASVRAEVSLRHRFMKVMGEGTAKDKIVAMKERSKLAKAKRKARSEVEGKL